MGGARVLFGDGPCIGVGCMRLSTEAERDEPRAIAVIQAALDAGARLVDTADAYCRDETDVGHNERLVRRALETWTGDRSRLVVATKGGLTRPAGRWVEDGRARHLASACERSLRALGVERIDLYQLHAPDPRLPLATSVRALAALQRDGRVEAIGLCNVSVRQIEESRRIVEVASVQVELSAFTDENLRNGVVEHCLAQGIRVIAHRPLGGLAAKRRLERDPLLIELAAHHGVAPQDIALAWLLDLAPLVIPIPGPTRPETARLLSRPLAMQFTNEERARLDARLAAGRLLRVPRAARRPSAQTAGEVVLVIGLPGAGKSTLALELVAKGYARLNRDERGGRLAALVPALDRALAAGARRVVLDNTYGSRAARNAVIETAWAHDLPVRCVWLRTSLEEAQVNAVFRLLRRYGKLPGPEELRATAQYDPAAFGPGVLARHAREWEPPELEEGFSAIDEVRFERRFEDMRHARAVLFWYDGVLRRSRAGARAPLQPEDVELLPGRAERLRRQHADGWLLLGIAWHPEIAAGRSRPERVEAILERTHQELGVPMEGLYCPHGDGPAVCWCRKPMPGLGVVFVERHQLDPGRCLYVGGDASDRGLARRLGFTFQDAREFFGAP